MNKAILAVAALLGGSGAIAQSPAPPPPGAAQPSLQAQFDAASSALAAHNWADALRLFQAMRARTDNSRTLAVVRVREASALLALGRTDEAAEDLLVALPLLPASDASLNDDRFGGLVSLGGIAERRFDYDEALRQFRLAAAVQIPEIDKLPARRGIVQTLLFSDPEAALREADAALAVVAAGAPANHELEGAIQTLRGRALLNLGRFQEARTALTRSMNLLGGLTMRVDLVDLVARSDLAIAALLAGAPEEARHYLAYTGAGQFTRGYLRLSIMAEPPPCGGELQPGDVAVIQAAVADDGRVVSATPIYASRRGGSALAFARAVADWSFDPESVTTIPLFFRTVARFEVRCSQSPHDRDYAESVNSIVSRMPAVNPDWGTAFDRLHRLPFPQVREALAAGGAPVVPSLLAVALSDAADDAERLAVLRRALTAAAAAPNSPPLLASLALAIGYASIPHRHFGDAPDYDALLALPEIAASPRAAIEIRLARARHDFYADHDVPALADASAIRDDPGLAADDPLKLQALELVTAVQAADGNAAGARAAHEAMGARAPRCSFFPRRKRIFATGGDFPAAALRWGFEGWARAEVMVGPNGAPTAVRTVIAYPAFVFAEAGEGIVRTARFDPIFVADGGACPAQGQIINFRIP